MPRTLVLSEKQVGFAFILSDEQIDKLLPWLEKHNAKHAEDKIHAAVGGIYTHRFTPTTIGMVSKVCCACGAEIDLSDYENW